MRVYRRVLAAIFLGAACWFTLAASAFAASTDTGVVRSYGADTSVRQGMIVRLTPSNPSNVEPLSSDAVGDMFGVAISPTDAPITVSGASASQVYVATSGQYNVLVSTENGVVHAGDYISISSLNGIGMKSQDAQTVVLGRAAADLTQASIVQSNVAIKTGSGTETVAIGSVPVAVAISSNPRAAYAEGILPGFLQAVSQDIAQKPVPASRVYLSLGVLLLAGFIAASVLYSGIRGGIVSIGRNPLARHAILGGIYQAIFAGVAVFVLGSVSVYLLLRL